MRHAFILLLLFFLPHSLPAASPPQFTVTGIDARQALAINNRGQVAGGGSVTFNEAGQSSAGEDDAFLWQGGQMTHLGMLPPHGGEPVSSTAYGINDAGQIVGSSGSGSAVFGTGLDATTAFLYQNGKMTPLGDQHLGFEADGINDKGQIVGSDAWRGFFYAKGKLVDFGTLSNQPAGNYSVASSINDAGQIVGSTTVYQGHGRPFNSHGFLYRLGSKKNRMQDLGTLPGWENSYASAINERGQIAGCVNRLRPHYSTQGVLWSHGKLIGLGYLSGTGTSQAFGMNDIGQIVGTSDKCAFLWQHGAMLDLNTLIPANSGWTLVEAHAINNKGQIVGTGLLNRDYHAFLLTPR